MISDSTLMFIGSNEKYHSGRMLLMIILLCFTGILLL